MWLLTPVLGPRLGLPVGGLLEDLIDTLAAFHQERLGAFPLFFNGTRNRQETPADGAATGDSGAATTVGRPASVCSRMDRARGRLASRGTPYSTDAAAA